MTKKNDVPVRLDADFKFKLDSMKRKVGFAQNKDLGLRELTRRMSRSSSMDSMEKELIEDAKAKRRFRI